MTNLHKLILFVFVALISLPAMSIASENYSCAGEDNAKIELVFNSAEAVSVTDPEGSETSIKFNEKTAQGTVYAAYDYDGYGDRKSVV